MDEVLARETVFQISQFWPRNLFSKYRTANWWQTHNCRVHRSSKSSRHVFVGTRVLKPKRRVSSPSRSLVGKRLGESRLVSRCCPLQDYQRFPVKFFFQCRGAATESRCLESSGMGFFMQFGPRSLASVAPLKTTIAENGRPSAHPSEIWPSATVLYRAGCARLGVRDEKLQKPMCNVEKSCTCRLPTRK